VAIPSTKELVDLCTGSFPCVAAEAGHAWAAAAPPDYLWGVQHPGAHYQPHQDATLFAARLLWEQLQPPYLASLAAQLEWPEPATEVTPTRLQEILNAATEQRSED